MDQIMIGFNNKQKEDELKNMSDLFDGSDIEPENDNVRLTGQLQKIFKLMSTGKWYTLSEVENLTGYTTASISAQLRNLRKKHLGSHTINKRRKGDRKSGLFEYQLIPSKQCNISFK